MWLSACSNCLFPNHCSRTISVGEAELSSTGHSFRLDCASGCRGVMRSNVMILPIYSRRGMGETWRRAEELGFHAAYTYDHLSWRSFRDGPWFAMGPTLAAATYL